MMQKQSMLKGYLFVIISAVLFGCMPLMAKYIYAEGVNSMGLVLLRNLLSLPFLALIGTVKHESFRVTPKGFASVVLIGVVGCALTPLLLFSSYQHINTGTATVFHFVYPAMVILLEVLFLRAKVSGGRIAAILLCVIGIALFYDPAESPNLVGSLLALISGVTYAVYVLLLGRFDRKGLGSCAFGFYAALGSTVTLLAVGLIGGGLAFPTSVRGWLLCIVFSVAINVGAVVLFQSGAFIIGGQKGAILSTFEPITSLIAGYLAFHEKVGPLVIAGSVLVIAASVVIAAGDLIAKRKEEGATAGKK